MGALVLIDAGHLIANANTMKYARTGNRGFLLLSVTPSVARGDFFFVPSVRERRYFPECGASFEAREAGGGETVSAPVSRDDAVRDASSSPPFRGAKLLKMTETECPALPESLFAGSDAPGYAGASRRATAKNDHRDHESSGGGYAVSFGAVVAALLCSRVASRGIASRRSTNREAPRGGTSPWPASQTARPRRSSGTSRRGAERAESARGRWSSARDDSKNTL